MKTTVIFSEGIKQIMLSPETESERIALSYLKADENIELAIKSGPFHSNGNVPASYNVGMCEGGYLRAWVNDKSVMLVLSPKKQEVEEMVAVDCLTENQIEIVVGWMQSYDQLKDTAIPLRFREFFRNRNKVLTGQCDANNS